MSASVARISRSVSARRTACLVPICQALAAIALPAMARAAPLESLEPILAVGTSEPRTLPVSEALRDQGTPRSLLGEEAIHEVATPFGDYGSLAKLTPSYVESAPNGEGFDAAKNQSLRGFTDTQFNLLVDDIPVQDPDTFAHHSTSYFPAATLSRVIVDRSPGGAADLGYANLGGTIHLSTLELPRVASTRLMASAGSFATSLVGATVSTGRPQAAGDGGALLNVEHLQSAGVLSNADGRKDDVLVKAEWRLAGGAQLTALYTFDRYHFNNPPNSTTLRLATAGSAYGFSADPQRADFYGYATTDRRADFGYVRWHAPLDGAWLLETTVYTYLYATTGLGLNGDETASPMPGGFGPPTTDIAGRLSNQDYRTTGAVVRTSHEDRNGFFQAGIWVDHSREQASRYAIDLSNGQFYNANRNNNSPSYYAFTSHLDTLQPYVSYQWIVTDALSVRPGVRHQQVRRGYDALVNQNFRPGTSQELTRTVSSTLPGVDATLKLDGDTSLLLQVARGTEVPGQALFYNTNTPAQSNQAQAQSAVAWQVGLVRETTAYDLGLTAYLVNFSNYIDTTTTNGVTVSANHGDVRYRGLELEGRVDLGAGFGTLANASLIRAEYQTAGIAAANQQVGQDVPLVPSYTGLAGLVFAEGAWKASLLAKFVGVAYQGAGGSASPARRVEPYHYADLTVTRQLGDTIGLQHVRLSLAVRNLQDQASVTDNGGPAAVAAEGNLLNTLPRRSLILSLVADL